MPLQNYLLEIFKKYNDVVVDDYVNKKPKPDELTVSVVKHVFHFNSEVEEYCKNEMNNKVVFLNVDENINANVFLGTVVKFTYTEPTQITITEENDSTVIKPNSEYVIGKLLDW